MFIYRITSEIHCIWHLPLSNPLLSMPPADRRRGQRNDAMHRLGRNKNAEAFLKAKRYREKKDTEVSARLNSQESESV